MSSHVGRKYDQNDRKYKSEKSLAPTKPKKSRVEQMRELYQCRKENEKPTQGNYVTYHQAYSVKHQHQRPKSYR